MASKHNIQAKVNDEELDIIQGMMKELGYDSITYLIRHKLLGEHKAIPERTRNYKKGRKKIYIQFHLDECLMDFTPPPPKYKELPYTVVNECGYIEIDIIIRHLLKHGIKSSIEDDFISMYIPEINNEISYQIVEAIPYQ